MSQKGADLKLHIAMERASEGLRGKKMCGCWTKVVTREVKCCEPVAAQVGCMNHPLCVCLTGALVCGDAGCLLLIRMRLPTEDNFRSTDS
jgi:hypothetical protein